MSDDELYDLYKKALARHGITAIDEGRGHQAVCSALRDVWEARRKLDAEICRNTVEVLDPSASPEHFAQAVEAH